MNSVTLLRFNFQEFFYFIYEYANKHKRIQKLYLSITIDYSRDIGLLSDIK